MQSANIHGNCVVLGRAGAAFDAPEDGGILILGPSGSGKSDLTLRLLERGAKLVADDRVELFTKDQKLWCRPPTALAGLLEVRSVGIIALSGVSDVAIVLAVEAVASGKEIRLPETQRFRPPAPLMLEEHLCPLLINISLTEPSAPAKVAVASAAAAHALFRDGRKL